MKSKYIFTGIIIALGGYLVISSVIGSKVNKSLSELLKQSQERIDSLESKNGLLLSKNDSIEKLYVIDSIKMDSLKRKNQITDAKANYYAGKYKDLLNETLKDCPDSLRNYQQRETILLSENEAVKQSNDNLRVQVSTIEISFAKCKEVNSNYKVITENNEQIKAEMQRSNELLQNRVDKLKKMNTLLKIGIGLAFLAGLAL